MQNLIRRSVLSVLTFVVAAAIPLSAQSTGSCDAVIVDDANVFGKDLGKVQATADSLQALGATVRIRTLRKGKTNPYYAAEKARCDSWHVPGDTVTRGNLVAVMYSVDGGDVGVRYGAAWRATLGPTWKDIARNDMLPRFRDHDYAAGFAVGVSSLTRLVNAHLKPPAAPTTIINQAPPADLSGLWKVLGWIVVLGALALIAILIRRFVQERNERRAAQGRALTARASASNLVNTLPGELEDEKILATTMAKQMTEADALSLKKDLDKASRALTSATTSYSSLSSSRNDPEKDSLSVAEYGSMERSYQGIFNSLNDAKCLIDGVRTSIENAKERAKSAPDQLRALQGRLATLNQSVASLKQRGFNIGGIEGQAADAKTSVDAAESALGSGQVGEFFRQLDLVGKALAAVEGGLNALAAKQKASADAPQQVSSRLRLMEAEVAKGQAALGRISSDFVPTSWASVRDYSVETEKRLSKVRAYIPSITAAASMEGQRFDDAISLSGECMTLLDETKSFVDAVFSLEKDLLQAKNDAPQELTGAETDIVKARAYIKRYDGDIVDSLEKDLDKLSEGLAAIRQYLAGGKEKLDYLVTLGSVRAIQKTVNGILDEARKQHDAAERKRELAQSALRDAQAALARTTSYATSYRSYAGPGVFQYTSQADQMLAQLALMSDTDEIIRQAAIIQSTADQHYAEVHEERMEAERVLAAARAEREEAERLSVVSSRQGDDDGGSTGFGGSNNDGDSVDSSDNQDDGGSVE
ncbi:MAG: chromosome segregation ATPase-like protein [Parcubacteria group bacterium]|nr:chromosome segregation ATPase-like protein [Parcubacteria group bacterium]